MTRSVCRCSAIAFAAVVVLGSPVATLASTPTPLTIIKVSAKNVFHPTLMAGHKVTFKQMLRAAARERALVAKHLGGPKEMPFRTGLSPSAYARLKRAALYNPRAPIGHNPTLAPFGRFLPNNLVGPNSFEGLADSAFICGPGGCQPPDMALAAGPAHVLQAVNTSVGVFDPTTQLEELGWPIPLDPFLGGTTSGPSSITGGCDPFGSFLSDPRAFFDSSTGHYWVTVGQFDGPAITGDSCPNTSIIWYAVSVDSNPNDGFFIYHFDVSFGGKELADYPTLGFDDKSDAVESSFNDFSYSTFSIDGSPLLYLEKAGMEAGTGPTQGVLYGTIACSGGPCGPNFRLDTIQPAETLAFGAADPGVDFTVSAFNFSANHGNRCGNPSPCFNVITFAVVHPFDGTFTNGANVQVTNNFVLAPLADVPTVGGTCFGCVETIDNRISATPVYNRANKTITWALETGINNGTQVVPGVMWAEETVILSGGPTLSTGIRQNNYIFSSGDNANSFGTTMKEPNGDLWVLTDVMGGTLYPGSMYAEHANLDGLNVLEPPILLRAGTGEDIFDGRWGDYEATSFDGTNVWFASQFINGGGDWDTQIGHNR